MADAEVVHEVEHRSQDKMHFCISGWPTGGVFFLICHGFHFEAESNANIIQHPSKRNLKHIKPL